MASSGLDSITTHETRQRRGHGRHASPHVYADVTDKRYHYLITTLQQCRAERIEKHGPHSPRVAGTGTTRDQPAHRLPPRPGHATWRRPRLIDPVAPASHPGGQAGFGVRLRRAVGAARHLTGWRDLLGQGLIGRPTGSDGLAARRRPIRRRGGSVRLRPAADRPRRNSTAVAAPISGVGAKVWPSASSPGRCGSKPGSACTAGGVALRRPRPPRSPRAASSRGRCG